MGMEQIELELLLFIHSVYDILGWWGVVGLMAIESACIPLPSEVIMPLSGWMLIEERALSSLFTLAAGFYGALGCTIGSAIAYWVGAQGGRPFLEKYGRYLLVSKGDLDLADRWFGRYGNRAIFISRLLPVVRTFISLPAGIAKMPFGTFLLYTFLGSFPWCFGLAYGGYQLGVHWEQIRIAMRPFEVPIILAIVAAIVFYIYRHLRQERHIE